MNGSLYREEAITCARRLRNKAKTFRKIGILLDLAEVYDGHAADLDALAPTLQPMPQQVQLELPE
jgi:hypothetical protein